MKKLLLKSIAFLLLLFFCGHATAQSRTITGTVTAKEDGSTIPGVTVTIKGTSNGTQTSVQGKFSLPVPAGDVTLVFRFIGYETQEVKAGSASVINVKLVSDFQQLSEVVVTGSGIATSKAKVPIV